MRSCQGCDSEYSDAEPFCPECGLGAGAARPDLRTPALESAGYEESTDVRSTRRTRTAVTSIIAVLVVIVGTLVGVVLARDPKPGSSTTAIEASHGPQTSVQEPTRTGVVSTSPRPGNLNPDPHQPLPSNPGSTGEQTLVRTAPALIGRPRVAETTELFFRYFTAINQQDEAAWLATLVPRPGLDWDGLKTTTDMNATVSAVDTTVTPIRATVSFTSHQAPSRGNGSACTNWSIVFPLTEYVGSLRIDRVKQRIISQQPCSH